jgi:DNA polymerase-3 subunit delta'
MRLSPLSDPAVRAFVKDPIVEAFLGAANDDATADDLVRAAAGAPGRLIAGGSEREITAQAQRLLDAAGASDRGTRYRVALSQGSSRARGSFTDTLDALTSLLHERARTAIAAGDESGALSASKAVEVVESAKEKAAGNVNPQLVTASLLHDIAGLVR